jgi:hypothetical protein
MYRRPRLTVHQQRRVTRLRRAGACVFTACICAAMFVYHAGVANHVPTIQELLPGTTRIIERERGILFGRLGIEMFRWYEALQEPAGQAGLVVLLGVIGAAACYQVAHRIEVEEG